jgi:aminoglycoside phosphotransferase (APT) family kinase protein
MADLHATPLERLPSDFPRDRTAAQRLDRILARNADVRDPLWDTVASILVPIAGGVRSNAPTLIHSDFWFGNTIWQDGRLTGIIDWDGARIGDPARDVAGARNDLFLARYGSARGWLHDLAFWDLMCSLPPIRWLSHWLEGYTALGLELSLSLARTRLEMWIEDARGRL